MEHQIQILHLEDDRTDAKIIEVTLRRDFPSCQITLVRTKQEYEARLDEQIYDIILADYQLPDYDGFSALAYAKHKFPTSVPFILVTGFLNEKWALDFLTHGAADYVLKDELVRLVPAMARALGIPMHAHVAAVH